MNDVFVSAILDGVVAFVKDHFEVDEVFEDDKVRDYVVETWSDPEYVYDFDTLRKWAENNGFVYEDTKE